MISTKRNSNFPEWIQVFAFGKFIDEVQGRAKALAVAKEAAKKHRANSVNHLGQIVQIDK